MRRLAVPLFAIVSVACGAGVRHDPTEPSLQLVPSASLPVQRTIGLRAIPQGVVSDVQLLVDGRPLAPLAPPDYAFLWDAGNEPEGTYRFSAVGRTAFGTSISSKPVPVVIDRTAPEVASYTPAPGSDPVPVSRGFTVTFSEPLLRASVGPATVTALRDGSIVDAAIALSADGLSVSVAPAARVRGSYAVALSPALTDLAGNALRPAVSNAVWSRVVEPPGPVTAQVRTFTNRAWLEWGPPADDGGGSPIAGYKLTQLDSGQTMTIPAGGLGGFLFQYGPVASGVPLGFALSAVTPWDEGVSAEAHAITPSYSGTLFVGQTAVALASGRVLVAGGAVQTASSTCDPSCLHDWPAALYDPGTQQWQSGIRGGTVRAYGTAARLADGRVLLAGGATSVNQFFPFLASAEIYDPSSNSFSPTGSMVHPQSGGRAVLLPDGRVLFGSRFGLNREELPLEIYDPDAATFVEVDSPFEAGRRNLLTVLQDGRVLLAGCGMCQQASSASALIFDPGPKGGRQFKFTETGPMQADHFLGTETLLPDGRVLLAGGAGDNRLCEVFDPTVGTFTPAANLFSGRQGHTATLLADGRVLFLGGSGQPTAEIYDPVNGGVAAPDLACPRRNHTASQLPGNKLLVLGGEYNLGVDGTCPEEVYTLP